MPPRKSIVSLTFDDGLEEQYNLFYPILNKYDLNATFYVVTNRIGWKGVMGWDELRTLHEQGHEIGSHTHTHRHLTKLSNKELHFEFKKSHDMLRPFNCNTLAYPYSECDDRVVEQARKCYAAAVGSAFMSNIKSKSLTLDYDSKERYKLEVFPIESSFPSRDFEVLQRSSLFQLPITKFKTTLNELLKHSIKRNAWIIFSLHGFYHGKNISWILKMPKETIKYFASLARRRSAMDFLRETALKKDRILKFKLMCKYLKQNDQLEVLPVSRVIKDYARCVHGEVVRKSCLLC